MVTRTYDGTYPESATADREVEVRSSGYVGEQIFLWVAWVVAFGFWAFAMQETFGILEEVFSRPASLKGGVGLGDMKFVVLSVAAFLVVSLALAYAAIRTARAGRSLERRTEAATAELYDEGARPRA